MYDYGMKSPSMWFCPVRGHKIHDKMSESKNKREKLINKKDELYTKISELCCLEIKDVKKLYNWFKSMNITFYDINKDLK